MNIEIPWIDLRDEKVKRLFELVAAAHYGSAMNNKNASSAAVVNSFFASRSFPQALSSAILAVGSHHAPIDQARVAFRELSKEGAEYWLNQGQKIPGFGNSFFKDGIDPQWQPVLDYLTECFPEKVSRINEIKSWIGKPIYPNPALFTAIACDLATVPIGYEAAVFALMRIPAWVSLLL